MAQDFALPFFFQTLTVNFQNDQPISNKRTWHSFLKTVTEPEKKVSGRSDFPMFRCTLAAFRLEIKIDHATKLSKVLPSGKLT